MLNTIKNIDKKFNILHLDYNEILLHSISGYMFNLNSTSSNPFAVSVKQKGSKKTLSENYTTLASKLILKGKIHFTSCCIVFEPEEISLPLIKLKYFDQNKLREIKILDICELDPTTVNIDLKSVGFLNKLVKGGGVNLNTNSSNYLINVSGNLNDSKIFTSNSSNKIIEDSPKNKKKVRASVAVTQSLSRYDEKAPLHIDVCNIEESLTKLIVKNKKKSIINNNNYITQEIECFYNYFKDNDIDPKYIFESFTNYLQGVANKDRDYSSFNFLELKTEYYKVIHRSIFKPYFNQEFKEDEPFLFLLEGKKKQLLDYKELINYMINGLKDNHEDTFLINGYIDSVITTKIKELEKEEKKNSQDAKINEGLEDIFNKSKKQGLNLLGTTNTYSDDMNIKTEKNQDIKDLDQYGSFKFQYFLFRLKVNRILPEGVQTGLFLIKDKNEIVFWPLTNNYKEKETRIKLSKIKYIIPYRYIHQHKALKIVVYKSEIDKLFEFETSEDCNEVIKYLGENCSNYISTYNNLNDMKHLWVLNRISNYDYLIYLNNIASRSFSDVNQYPIFPWIFKDYKSNKIDISDESFYRDLSKPIGALGKNSHKAKLNFEETSNEIPFNYPFNYSNSSIINHFLIRKFPQLVQNFESGSFGKPDRMFKSIVTLWDHLMFESGDLRELIPEFYSDEDFLISSEPIYIEEGDSLNLLNSIQLPNWAKTAHEFINIQKNGLESDYVSKNLHHWIDLIFGVKQSGKEGENAQNIFPPYAYEENFNNNKFNENFQIYNEFLSFGQVPVKLFHEGHIARNSKNIFISESDLNHIFMKDLNKENRDKEITEKICEKIRRSKEEAKEKMYKEIQPQCEEYKRQYDQIEKLIGVKENEFLQQKLELKSEHKILKKRFDEYDKEKTKIMCKWAKSAKEKLNKDLLDYFPNIRKDVIYVQGLEKKYEEYQIKAFNKMTEIELLHNQLSEYEQNKVKGKQELVKLNNQIRKLPYHLQIRLRKEKLNCKKKYESEAIASPRSNSKTKMNKTYNPTFSKNPFISKLLNKTDDLNLLNPHADNHTGYFVKTTVNSTSSIKNLKKIK